MQTYNNDKVWIGQKFSRLTVIGFEKKKPPQRGWNWAVRCDCGKEFAADPYAVKSGNTKSCGCLKNEVAGSRLRRYTHNTYVHKRLYEILSGIKKRCNNPNSPRYKDYGGRGIKVCDEWTNLVNGWDNFVDWAYANGYNDTLTIERKDVNGDYCPENCCWVTRKAQASNKRETRWIVYKGECVQLRALCERIGLRYYTIYDRIYKSGWPVEKAIETKSQQEDSLRSKCKERGLNYITVRDRIVKLGWTEEQALSTPTMGRGANLTTYGRKLEKKICAVCGAEFSPNISKQKYCGPKCHAESKHAWFKKQQQQTSR